MPAGWVRGRAPSRLCARCLSDELRPMSRVECIFCNSNTSPSTDMCEQIEGREETERLTAFLGGRVGCWRLWWEQFSTGVPRCVHQLVASVVLPRSPREPSSVSHV